MFEFNRHWNVCKFQQHIPVPNFMKICSCLEMLQTGERALATASIHVPHEWCDPVKRTFATPLSLRRSPTASLLRAEFSTVITEPSRWRNVPPKRRSISGNTDGRACLFSGASFFAENMGAYSTILLLLVSTATGVRTAKPGEHTVFRPRFWACWTGCGRPYLGLGLCTVSALDLEAAQGIPTAIYTLRQKNSIGCEVT